MNRLEKGAYQTGEVVGKPLAQLEMENGELTPEEQTILWANQLPEAYNSLPKGKVRQRRAARNLLVQTARYLIENPQYIDVAGSVWKSRKTKEEKQAAEWGQKTESFYDLVKQEVSLDIIKLRMTTTGEQFGQFVRVCADSVLMRDVFYDLLEGYTKRPQPVKQLLTVQEASGLLRVDPNTVRRWGKNGILKPVARLGPRGDRRYSWGDVIGLIDKG